MKRIYRASRALPTKSLSDSLSYHFGEERNRSIKETAVIFRHKNGDVPIIARFRVQRYALSAAFPALNTAKEQTLYDVNALMHTAVARRNIKFQRSLKELQTGTATHFTILLRSIKSQINTVNQPCTCSQLTDFITYCELCKFKVLKSEKNLKCARIEGPARKIVGGKTRNLLALKANATREIY